MKVALCTEILHPLFGVERRVYEMAKRLEKYGIEVTVFTSTEQYSDEINVEQLSNPTIYDPPKRNYAFCIDYWKNIVRRLSKRDYDIIDANGHLALIPCSLSGFFYKKDVIATIHDLYLNDWKTMYKGFGHFFGLPMEITMSKMPYSKIITLNSTIKKKMTKILKINEEKIEIIPSGIDVRAIDSIKQKEKIENRIIYVGRLVPQKNVDILIKAFSSVDDAELVIIGDGSEKQKLILLANKLGISDKITFRDKVEAYDEIISEMKKSSILVLPSKRECFGIVPLEAMASRTAVISTNTDGPRDYIENGRNGFLTKIDDDKGIAENINRLLESRNILKKIQANGRKTAESYDWEKIVKKISDVYMEFV